MSQPESKAGGVGEQILDHGRRLLLLGAPVALTASCVIARGSLGPQLGAGASSFVFADWAGPAFNVFTYAPATLSQETPLAFIMHGQGRNASDYRDQWVDVAEAHGLAIAAPEFSRENFPRSDDYNLGRRFDEAGAPIAVEQWSFSAIEPLFDVLRGALRLRAQTYGIYGHSAGAQFVHRYMLHMPQARVRHAVSANAGWYTLPDAATPRPFGLGGEAIGDEQIQAYLGRPMTVLLGTKDIDTEQSSLNRTPQAMQQGPHRLARGRFFFEAGRARAEALDCKFNWRLAYAPNIDHDNSRMASHAIAHLLA